MIICGQSFSSEIISKIQALIDADPKRSRVALSRAVCGCLNWRAENGKLKEMSCRVALLKLHRRGLIRLAPRVHPRPPARSGRALGASGRGREGPPITGRLAELGRIELVPVSRAESAAARVWNEFMQGYHYLGAGPLCGAQLRYLIRSEKAGWLGGLAFSAGAWRVAARDRWIGWDDRTRTRNLRLVVCNSRFLICPWVRIPHLASHVLALSTKRLRRDWPARYGYAPELVETFVERARFRGTSYRAANWTRVGQTRGRGRQDRHRRQAAPVKDVYVYPLSGQARQRLCEGSREASPAGRRAEGSGDWCEVEWGGAPLDDARLRKRLVTLGRDFYARPQGSIPQACQSRAKTKAAYRFFEHEATTMEKLLEAHYRATETRIAQERVVLAVQDTTSLNYRSHPATEGLGPIGNRAEAVGFELHDTMAFNLAGTPLGLINVQCWARHPQDYGQKKRRQPLPITEKESAKWLSSFAAVAAVAQRCPETTLVSVGDREADIYELFHQVLNDPSGAHLLVRLAQNRRVVAEPGRLWETMAAQPVAGTQELRVPRRGSAPARDARLAVRFAAIRLRPRHGKAALGEF